jgi:hypothetical protein
MRYAKNGRKTKAEEALVNRLKELIKQTGTTKYKNKNFYQPYELSDAIEALEKEIATPTAPKANAKLEFNQTPNTKEAPETMETEETQEAQVVEETPPQANDIPDSFEFADNPMAEDYIDRDYSNPELDYHGEVPEFNPEAAPISSLEPDANGNINPPPTIEERKEEILAENQERDLNLGTRQEEVSQTVDAALGVYEFLHTVARKFSSINEDDLRQRIMKGEINPNITIPLDADGEEGNILQYAKYHNEQINEVVKYDPEFGKKVKPAMKREFAKRGIVMGDGAFIATMFIQNMAQTGTAMLMMKKQGNDVMNAFVALSKQIQAQQQQTTAESVSPDEITKPSKNDTE